MATEKQIAANQRNAERSTGPKSAEGKEKVARNALKHGLAGHGVIFPEEMAGQIQDRREFFWKSCKPDGPLQQWFYDRICIESVRADHCLHRSIALKDEAATRAGESWDDDRALEAEELGGTLSKQPERVQPRLLQSKHGALWLLAQWEELERRHERLGRWAEADSDRALDLLGLQGDAREGAWESLTGGGVDGVRALIAVEVAAVKRRLEAYLDARDERARSDAEAGLGLDGPELRRVLRYEAEVLRRLRAWTRALERLQEPGSKSNGRDHRGPDGPGRGPGGPGRGPSEDRPPAMNPPRDLNRPDRSSNGVIDRAAPGVDGPQTATTHEPDAITERPTLRALASNPPLNRRARRARAAEARRARPS